MKKKSVVWLLAACVFAGIASGAESALEFVLEQHKNVEMVQARFERTDSGELQFRCRLVTKNERLVNAVAHVLFEAFAVEDEEEVLVWSQKRRVLRNQFDERFGGFVGLFVREEIEGLPKEYNRLLVSFVNEPPAEAE